MDYLKSKNFKYVQGSTGLHEGTYKIFVNFINYSDMDILNDFNINKSERDDNKNRYIRVALRETY